MPTTLFCACVWILLDNLVIHREALNPIQFGCMFITTCGSQQCVKTYGNCNEEERGRSFCVESTFPQSHPNSSLKRQRNIFWRIFWCFVLLWVSLPRIAELKMKGIYKGFKYTLSQMFVVKEREIEIGLPTDVKHVAHIGWDGNTGNSPSWMNGFNTGPNFAAASIGNTGSALSPWSSQDFGDSMQKQSGIATCKDVLPSDSDIPNVKKKPKRKKSKSNSPKSSSCSNSKSLRAAKSKTKLVEGDANAKPSDIEVA